MIGRVKKVIKDRAFGFVNHNGVDLFFHRNNFLYPDDYDLLEPGDLIDYRVNNLGKYDKAENIIFAKSDGGK